MLNKVVLMGRLVADPELKQTPGGLSVCQFRIAVERNFTSNGERQADFISIVAWRQAAEFVSRYFKKGQMIAVEGTLQSRNFTDKQGNKRVSYEVVADRLHFCGSKNENTAAYPSNTDAKSSSSNQLKQPKFEDPAKEGETFAVGDLENEADQLESIDESLEEDLPF